MKPELWLDVQWRNRRFGHDPRHSFYFERVNRGPRWPRVFFELFVGRLSIRYG